MKAIVLASGVGKRLQPLTNYIPKPLIRVRDKTILDYQLESLIRYGINDIVITTGPFKEKIQEHVRRNYAIEVQFIHNPEYETTNYIYTLWLTRDVIDRDIILLHGDLLFDSILIGRLMKAKNNCVLVNKGIKPPKKDFKAVLENSRVIKIGVEFSGANAYFCAPMYKLSKLDFLHWLDEIKHFIKQGKVNCYAEDAFNKISDKILLRPLYFKEFCMEIDTIHDLDKAKNWLRNRGSK